jgi:hypothetical protein
MLLGAALAIALLVYTFWPEKPLAAQPIPTRLDALLERKEQLDENLRDLDFDRQTGKVPPQDFDRQRTALAKERKALEAQIAASKKE